MMRSLMLLLVLPALAQAITRLDPQLTRQLLHSGRPQIGLFQTLLEQQREQESLSHHLQHPQQSPFSIDQGAQTSKYGPHCFTQPLSHFDDSLNSTFCQRYWLDTSYYRPGGPVFVLDGGETDGAGRIPYLEKGILQILANATGGLPIVLEHRYYGESVPVEDFSTDNLRFLNNEEAMEDSADFVRHFELPKGSGIQLDVEDQLKPHKTPWIYYGGSYAGARAAHMRVEYPELVWGAIASSGVTHAQVDYPEYWQPIQQYGPEECIAAIADGIETVDKVLDMGGPAAHLLKSLFGLGDLSDNSDFADVLAIPLGFWQAQNWDPEFGSDEFTHFCEVMTEKSLPIVNKFTRLPSAVVNYAKYVRENIVPICPPGEAERCFGTQNDTTFQQTGLDQIWRLWEFQVCTQWGYFQTSFPEGPRIVSKRIDLEYSSKPCRKAYPPGKHFTVPELPDVTNVNARGDFAIETDRLAFIDGDRDPWRPATPGSDMAPKRKSTVNKPVHLIFDAIHHYDENGLADHSLEPARIRDVHELEVNFISEWIAQFHEKDRV